MPWHKNRLWSKMGFRGSCLLLFAISDFGHGVIYTLGHATHPPVGGNHFWGYTFFILGAFLLTGVWSRRDYWQYIASGFVMTVWGFNYLWTVLDVPYQWGNAIAWLCFSVLPFLLVMWPEPYRIIKDWPRKPVNK